VAFHPDASLQRLDRSSRPSGAFLACHKLARTILLQRQVGLACYSKGRSDFLLLKPRSESHPTKGEQHD